MKTDSIEQLLERYREGTLDADGMEELGRLSRRDEVMAAAGARAHHIIRRRTRIGIGMCVVVAAVAGATLWALLPQHDTAQPLVAETAPATTVETAAEQPLAAPQPQHESVAMVQPVRKSPATTNAPSHKGETPRKAKVETPVVVCNNQCEADSVISDIWKFLTA